MPPLPLSKAARADCCTRPTAWGEMEIQRFLALALSCPLPSTAALQKRRHKHLVWLQKSCLSGIILFGSQEGAQYQSVPLCCTMLRRLCCSQTWLASFTFLDLPQVNLCCSLGSSCPVQKVKTVLGDRRTSSNPAKLFLSLGCSYFLLGLSMGLLACGRGGKEGRFNKIFV